MILMFVFHSRNHEEILRAQDQELQGVHEACAIFTFCYSASKRNSSLSKLFYYI